MIRHVALFRFVADATPGDVAALAAGLDALPGLVPGIVAYEHGPDLGVGPGNADYAVTATFADLAAWEAYRDHPEHRAVLVDLLTPILAERTAVQVEVP